MRRLIFCIHKKGKKKEVVFDLFPLPVDKYRLALYALRLYFPGVL